MITFLLAQLWWLMPIIVALVYFVVGHFICRALIKNEHIQSVGAYWFYFICWLPAVAFGLLWKVLSTASKLPRRIAERQLNQH